MSNLLRFKDNCISLEDIYDNDDALCDFCAVASGNGGSGDCSNHRCIDGIRKWLDMPFAYTYSDTDSFLRKFDDPDYKFSTEEIKKMCTGGVGEVIKVNIIDRYMQVIVMELIFEINDRFFRVNWTENIITDDQNYSEPPVEVRRMKKRAYDYIPCQKEWTR